MCTSFSGILKQYLEDTHCGAKDLAQASSLSRATISRYLNDRQLPGTGSETIGRLAHGLAQLGAGDEKEILLQLRRSVMGIDADFPSFSTHFRQLIKTLAISNNDLARTLGYDPSYISRIQQGSRKPAGLHTFIEGTAQYIIRNRSLATYADAIAELTGCTREEALQPDTCAAYIRHFLSSSQTEAGTPLEGFLGKLDSYTPAPPVPADQMIFPVPGRNEEMPALCGRFFRGIEGMKKAELEFLQLAAADPDGNDVIFYSDMPLYQMAKDEYFYKNWAGGIASLVRRGLRLHVIHDVCRPMQEMMIGLAAWIPLYMTGLISPWYLDGQQGSVFTHLLRAGTGAALSGQGIASAPNDGMYYLTTDKEMAGYYRLRAEQLLGHASPLMRIYRSAAAQEYLTARNEALKQSPIIRSICYSLPMYTLSEELLTRVLVSAGVPEAEIRRLCAFRSSELQSIENYLQYGQVILDVPELTETDFRQCPMSLSLSDAFCETDVQIDYAAWQEHLQLTREFAAGHAHISIRPRYGIPLKNIRILVAENIAIVSRNRFPAAHFLIEHPKMLAAFKEL